MHNGVGIAKSVSLTTVVVLGTDDEVSGDSGQRKSGAVLVGGEL
jgi:hypothetical protein